MAHLHTPRTRRWRSSQQVEPESTAQPPQSGWGMWRNRACACAVVIAFLIFSGGFASSGNADRRWFDLVVVPIGYAHLIGALWSSRRRAPIRRCDLPLIASCILTLLCVYSWALQGDHRIGCLGAILLVSMWHTLENDLMLGRAYANGWIISPLPRRARVHVLVLSGSASLGFLALATPYGVLLSNAQRWLVVPVLFASIDHVAIAGIVYHLASWSIFLVDRSRSLPRPESWALRRNLLLIHALPLALNAAIWVWIPSVQACLASLPLYLFWSAAHAFHTAWVRGVEAV